VAVISADGKGIVIRPDALRPATMAAREDTHKLKSRLSKSEQRNSKCMAELAVVYDTTPLARTPGDVFSRSDDGHKAPAPLPPSTRQSAVTRAMNVRGLPSSTAQPTRSP
jgi:hypothetical protein